MTHNPAFNFSYGIIAAIVAYIVFALPFYTMGQKKGIDHCWFAFVPILNIILMLEIADKPIWWIILFFIPCINLIFGIIVWMAIAEAMGKESWWGILMIVPFLNIVIPFILAYG